MKYSEWQSGAIAPIIDGWYERRSSLHGECDKLTLGHYKNLVWYTQIGEDEVVSFWQKNRGHLWQWRGRIDE